VGNHQSNQIKCFFFFSLETLTSGISAIVDAQKCNWRVARIQIRHVTTLLGENLKNLYVIRPEAFWEKQRVENCAKAHKKGEVSKTNNFLLLKTVFYANQISHAVTVHLKT
jgi:hypothetical protein